MTRIERTPLSPSPRRFGSGWIAKVAKGALWIVRLPFKVTFRLLFILIVLFIFVEILRTGMWHVPIISDIVYHKPEPTYEVQAVPYSKELFTYQLEETIVSSLGNMSPTFSLSEGQLTALLQTAMANEPHQPFIDGQMAIQEQHIEFYGNLKSNPNVFITAHLTPDAENDALQFHIERVRVGNVQMPESLMSSGVVGFLSSTFLSMGFPLLTFDSVVLAPHEMQFKGITI